MHHYFHFSWSKDLIHMSHKLCSTWFSITYLEANVRCVGNQLYMWIYFVENFWFSVVGKNVNLWWTRAPKTTTNHLDMNYTFWLHKNYQSLHLPFLHSICCCWRQKVSISFCYRAVLERYGWRPSWLLCVMMIILRKINEVVYGCLPHLSITDCESKIYAALNSSVCCGNSQ